MKNFNYHIPTDIYFGKGKIRVLGDKITAIGQNILLVYGGGSIKKSGLYDQVIDELNRAGVTVSESLALSRIRVFSRCAKGLKSAVQKASRESLQWAVEARLTVPRL